MTALPEDVIQVKAFGPDSVNIQCADTESFRIIQKYLHTNNTEFHIFSLPSERTIKIVIKGLLINISAEEVAEELTNSGYEIQKLDNSAKQTINYPFTWYHSLTLHQIKTFLT